MSDARSLSRDAWFDLRRSWIFWLAATTVVLMLLLAAVPGVFSSLDARTATCALSDGCATWHASAALPKPPRSATATRYWS